MSCAAPGLALALDATASSRNYCDREQAGQVSHVTVSWGEQSWAV